MKKLDGKVAIVSGSGRGIGREVALQLAAEGARIVINDLDEAPARETVAEIEAAGGEAVACLGSVTDDEFADRFVGTAVDSFGGLDIIVNNAGFTWDSVIQKMTDEQWDAVLDVHLKAPFRILRAAQPVISRAAKAEIADHGVATRRAVVNVTSISGIGGNAGQANYASAKAGVTGLTKTLAKEWGRYNVTVNAVGFGLIQTRLTGLDEAESKEIDIAGRTLSVGVNEGWLEQMRTQTPLGRPGLPSEAAGAIVLLTLPESSYITGQVLVANGGFDG